MLWQAMRLRRPRQDLPGQVLPELGASLRHPGAHARQGASGSSRPKSWICRYSGHHRDARALTAPLSTVAFPLSWTDAASAEAIVRKSLSPRGTTRVDRRTNTLFVTDAFDDPGASELQSRRATTIFRLPPGASGSSTSRRNAERSKESSR